MFKQVRQLALALALITTLLACQIPGGATPAPAQPTDSGLAAPSGEQTQPTDSGLAAPGGEQAQPAGQGKATEAAQPLPIKKTPTGNELMLATSTFTENSALLARLIEAFTAQTGYPVFVVSKVNPNQVLEVGQAGQADVLLSHAPVSELTFMKDGYGGDRRLVMHNDFVLVGPATDPAGVKGSVSAAEAFKKIAQAQSPFASRGDNSVVERMEKYMWKKSKAPIPTPGATPWYFETAQNMFQTLKTAAERQAYTLTDRESFLSMKNINLAILYEGDKFLLNYYHVIVLSQEKFPSMKMDMARAFADFIVSPEAQKIITEYGADVYGQPVFFADAGKTEEEVGLPTQAP